MPPSITNICGPHVGVKKVLKNGRKKLSVPHPLLVLQHIESQHIVSRREWETWASSVQEDMATSTETTVPS